MSKSVRVRMYNVGFGDCFLLTLPNKQAILVDAGFHSQGKGAFSAKELVDQVIADVTEIAGKPRIDVVIATHRHQDHIFAFNASEWDGVEVGEVWMPWLEDRKNPEATKLWKKQQGFAMQLAAVRGTFGLSAADLADVEFMLWNAGIDLGGIPMDAAVANWSNKNALDCLHEGFAHRDRPDPRFLPSKTCPESFESSMLPGVTVHVLGPPRDAELIEELDPEADGETYRAMALRSMEASNTVTSPFGEAWLVRDDEPGEQLDQAEIERIESLGRSADAVFAAEKVDGMINSTSLVLVMDIGKARLLLPGDAEWGTWRRILATDEARSLLRGATFFKVGHHGSHNATSKTLVEQVLPKKIPAMISTQQGPGRYRNNIPLSELLDALKVRNINYARSDVATGKLPAPFRRGNGAKWIDVKLPC
jgi:beta-lactamase superfamily II metal-dependent hydrolase